MSGIRALMGAEGSRLCVREISASTASESQAQSRRYGEIQFSVNRSSLSPSGLIGSFVIIIS